MTENTLVVLLSTLVLFVSAMVYIAPLRKRERWQFWMAPMFVVFALGMNQSFALDGFVWYANQAVLYLCVVAMVNRCTKLSLAADFYCGVWILVSGGVIHELWMGLLLWQKWPREMWVYLLSLAAFSALCFFGIYKTIARWMPQGDLYQIGPRQLGSAWLLGGLCVGVSQYFLVPQPQELNHALFYLMIQCYCITLLYLQTELFKKSQMEQDLEVMYMLYSREQQQYAAACQNLRALEAKYAQVEQAVARMPQGGPEEKRPEEYGRFFDSMVRMHTGNHVLDVVLTEKAMLGELHQVQLSCVADGKLLDFMDVVDIYAIFSNALDNAIEAVQTLQEKNHRLIDVLVHSSQNFLVINISNPLASSLEFEEGLPVTTKKRSRVHGFGLKVLRYAVERYDGMFTVETGGGRFTLKVLIPMRSLEKKKK